MSMEEKITEEETISEKELLALQVLPEYSWDMRNYIMGVLHQSNTPTLTMYAVKNMFQLDPPPPELGESKAGNAYILEALKQKNLDYFSYFLHTNESYFNRVIRRTLAGDADIRYDPEQFMDIKLSCAAVMLHLLPSYDPSRKATFRTYAYRYVQNAIRQYQRRKESWSFDSLSLYKKVRTAAWMQKNLLDAAEKFVEKYKCDLAAAEKYFAEIKIYANNRNGLLADVSKALTEKNINILSMNTRTSKQGLVTMATSFEIRSREELIRVIDKMRTIESVIDIERTTG